MVMDDVNIDNSNCCWCIDGSNIDGGNIDGGSGVWINKL